MARISNYARELCVSGMSSHWLYQTLFAGDSASCRLFFFAWMFVLRLNDDVYGPFTAYASSLDYVRVTFFAVHP